MREIIANENNTIKEIIDKLNNNGRRMVVIKDDGKLKGIITDGDIRRWVTKDGDMNVQAKKIINYTPISIKECEKKIAHKVMKKNSIDALPVIDEAGYLKSVIFWDDIEIKDNSYNDLELPVVIMAGGLGTRLYPYTKILPKPLIPIGDIPIAERIINKFLEVGCREYYMTVNYKKNMIKSYFGDLDKNYEMSYIEEEKPLGTGGSLYLLKDKLRKTFFLSNCDIIVEANYNEMYKKHKEEKNKVTIICALKNLTIPYGVIKLDYNGEINDMVEKPQYSFLTNTGMYIVEPEVLDDIKENEFANFPDIIEDLRQRGEKVGVYSIAEECWLDMGQIDEMQNMIKQLEG